MTPGAIALTVIFGASSMASDEVIWWSAALEALYAMWLGRVWPRMLMSMKLMILPRDSGMLGV